MIQFKRKLYGLDKLYYDYVDNDPRSRNIFRTLEMPETFNLGRNQFKILANNDLLLKKSKIYIDVVDANGEAIYYEISPIANKDNSRSIIVYIYPDTPAGNCIVRIASRLRRDPVTREDIFFNDNLVDEPNVLWQKSINVSPYLASESRIKFLEEPVVNYRERIEYLQVISGSSRLTNEYSTGTGSISIDSRPLPMQFVENNLTVEKVDIKKREVGQPKRIDSSTSDSNVFSTPYFSDNSVIVADGFTFSASMQGGVIYANKISITPPVEALETAAFSNISYSASIIKVINDKMIEVYPPYSTNITYRTATGESKLFSTRRFTNHGNFTASFYDSINLSSSLTTQSFLELNLYGIESVSGLVDSVNVGYKPINSFGDFIDLGSYDIVARNLLVESSSITFSTREGIVERPLGFFPSGAYDFTGYWEVETVGNVTASIGDNTNVDLKISDGIFIRHTGTGSEDRYLYARPKSTYDVYAYAGSEFVLKFSSYSEFSSTSHVVPAQIDVFISGSNRLFTDFTTDRLVMNPLKVPAFGTYVGSIASTNGSLRETTISFIVKESGYIRPIFAFRSGQWHFGKIQLLPRKELGFGSNQAKIFVPLENVKRETELIMRLEYADKNGIKSDNDTMIYGVTFQGGSQLQFDEIENYPVNGINQTLNYLESYRKVYVTQSIAAVSGFVPSIEVRFPIFRDKTGIPYTGSLHNVGLSFQVDTVVFGRTGSAIAPMDTYTWAGSLQGRAIVTSFDNSGAPLLFNVTAVSGSNLNSLGTFGNGPSVKTNLDSWFRLNSVSLTGTDNDILRIRYAIAPSHSFAWSASMSSVCTVYKYEHILSI